MYGLDCLTRLPERAAFELVQDVINLGERGLRVRLRMRRRGRLKLMRVTVTVTYGRR